LLVPGKGRENQPFRPNWSRHKAVPPIIRVAPIQAANYSLVNSIGHTEENMVLLRHDAN
jgi:hypothetical protein